MDDPDDRDCWRDVRVHRIQDPLGLIPEDEPVFLLRAKDMLAPSILKLWAYHLRLSGGQVLMAQLVEEHADKMMEWQEKNGCKIPDMDFSKQQNK